MGTMGMRTPRQALDRAINFAIMSSFGLGRPGAVIQKMPADVRELLQQLTAADAQVRADDWVIKVDPAYPPRR